ncbi:MAG: 4Fe-4S dicluster domain-containing protein, partial [Candidatus Woesearchaeota archaeon]|nr:4Fe-4S dicluster domain-containing protein [Candidatus Woesearchaeota archaeon]
LTKKGEELVKLIEKRLYPWAVEYEREKPIPYVEKDVDTENKDVWERYGKDCLSCSACNVVCPTCVCFTIEGHLNLDFRSGHRHREWASCQLPEFTKVAGNFVFRKDRGARGKQRIHCKFFYFKNKYNYARCVGCGRCNLACPVGINIYEYHDALK